MTMSALRRFFRDVCQVRLSKGFLAKLLNRISGALAEQALRFIAVLRRITQGTRGTTGRIWSERIWTVIGTCAIQDRSTFEFLVEAITAQITHQPAPSLLPRVESSA